MLFKMRPLRNVALTMLCMTFLALLAPLSRADLLFSESFDYPDGPLWTGSGGLWSNTSGTTTNTLGVAGGRALLEKSDNEDMAALVSGGPYTSATNVALYWSFRLVVSQTATGSDNYFAHLSGGAFHSRIFATTNSAAAGMFRMGIANSSTAPSVQFPADLSTNTEIVALVKYVPATQASTLWVNPASETDPSVTATDTVTATSISRVGLRQNNQIGVLYVDDLRVGTNFAEVLQTAVVTPPSVEAHPPIQTVYEGQSAVFTSEANGTPPFDYQWLYNGSPIAGATATALALMNLQTNQSGAYALRATNSAGSATSNPAILVIDVRPPWDGSLKVLTWNVKGNNVTDWSTNSPQVRAIGRVIQHLAPDIITFNEIPSNRTWEMTNWVTAFLPGWYLATNSGTDNYIRSVIASRFPILSSQKHLDGVSLAPFGTGLFTRDLFQARIRVPAYAMPVDVFTTHLKASTSGGQADYDKRGAEARAISNFIAHVYLPTNGGSAYLLTGDLNEDVFRPAPAFTSRLPIQNLANPHTGLSLITPTNPVTLQDLTLSIHEALNVRFDYVLPCAALETNLVSSMVFRTDVLTNPVVSQVFSNDSRTASDHLPVLAVFRNPNWPVQPLVVNGVFKLLSWESAPGELYLIRSADNAGAPVSLWTVEASNFVATSYVSSATLVRTQSRGFFTVERLP
jgi:endonuclease/exonuclease/phosphatase family metal-dependent hydrolase